MNQTTYTADNDKKSITVERTFDAPLTMVWKAWTESTILDQWWAPKPWKANTQSMNFTEGGAWRYYMQGPEGERHYCKCDYREIQREQYYSGVDCFCDEQGNRNMDMPSTIWHVAFAASGNTTMVTVTLSCESVEALETLVKMGFKEGFAMAHQNLDAYLQAQQALRNEAKTSTAARTTTYVNFDGNTEEAMNFYKKVFRTEFSGRGIQRFGDIPQGEGQPAVPDNIKNMILHVELPITGGHILMATDAPKEMGFNLTRGNNMHICLEPDNRTEAKRLFDELSVDGKVTMPLADMFFGALFGEFTDQYGINWMVNCTAKE